MKILYKVICTNSFLIIIHCCSVFKSEINMIVQPVKIASTKNLTHLKTVFLYSSRYYMPQLTILISTTLRNELAKNAKMNDFARCTHVQQRLVLFNLYMLTKLHGKVLQRLPCSGFLCVVFFK